MKHKIFFLFLILALLAACSSEQAATPNIQIQMTDGTPHTRPTPDSESQTFVSTAIAPAPTTTLMPLPRDPTDWKSWLVIPTLSPQMLTVYSNGQAMGRDAHVVSVVGDCESLSDWFLKDFSKDERYYNLGPYTSLQETIDYFNPSLGYSSYAAIRGATASTVLSTLWSNPQACESNETPLACEYRLHNPAFAVIALGTNDIYKRDQFEPKMRAIVEYTLELGIVPIIVTKADNLEGDESINLTLAELAVEYHLPVWNFWLAVQPLPRHGLQEDGVHLTFASNFFNDPEKLKRAWPVRNLTALQVLEALRLEVQE